MNIDTLRARVAIDLFHCGAFKDKSQSEGGKGFWHSGHRAPYDLNLRTQSHPRPGPLTAELAADIGFLMLMRARALGIRFDRVAGIPYSGNPLSEAFVEAANMEGVLLKLEKVNDGEATEIKLSDSAHGTFSKMPRVLAIDDTVKVGDTKLEAIQALHDGGLEVKDVLVCVDLDRGGLYTLADYGYQLHSVFKISQLLGIYRTEHLLSQSICDEIIAYLHGRGSG